MPKDRSAQWGGEYIGNEEFLKGKWGKIKPFGEVVKMQFDDGPAWLTHSWITLPTSDVVIYEDNPLEDFDDNPLDFDDSLLDLYDNLLDFECEDDE